MVNSAFLREPNLKLRIKTFIFIPLLNVTFSQKNKFILKIKNLHDVQQFYEKFIQPENKENENFPKSMKLPLRKYYFVIFDAFHFK